MRIRFRTMAAALLALGGMLLTTAVEAGALAGAPALDTLAPGQYSVKITGPARARGMQLKAGEGDIQLDDQAMLDGEGAEKAIYTREPVGESSDEHGPYQIRMTLAGRYVDMPNLEHPGVQIGLHLNRDLSPGTYSIDEAYFDVGPGAVPVAAMAMVVSANRGMEMMFNRDVSGTLELEKRDREGATGRFAFEISARNATGPLHVSGAFRDIPWTPGER